MDGGRTQGVISLSKKIYFIFFFPTFIWLTYALDGMWLMAIAMAVPATLGVALVFYLSMLYVLIPFFNWCVKNQD
jgi:hypothetical protein